MNKLTIIAIIIFLIAGALLIFGLTTNNTNTDNTTFKAPAGFEETPLMKENKLPKPTVAQYNSYDTKYHINIYNYTEDFYQECIKDPDTTVDSDIVKIAEKNGNKFIVEVSGDAQAAYMLDEFLKVNGMKS